MTCAGADNDCPNCGLANYDVGSPDYPFCDRLCAVAFAERRALRKLRIELAIWNLRAMWSRLRHRSH